MARTHQTDDKIDEEMVTVREIVGPHKTGHPEIVGTVSEEDKEAEFPIVVETAHTEEVEEAVVEETTTCMISVTTSVVLDAASQTDDCQQPHSVFPLKSG